MADGDWICAAKISNLYNMAKYIAVYFVIFDKTPPDVEYLSIASIASVAPLQRCS